MSIDILSPESDAELKVNTPFNISGNFGPTSELKIEGPIDLPILIVPMPNGFDWEAKDVTLSTAGTYTITAKNASGKTDSVTVEVK
jgi:hypothetical protein